MQIRLLTLYEDCKNGKKDIEHFLTAVSHLRVMYTL